MGMRLAVFISASFLFALAPARAGAAEPLASAPYRIDYDGWYTIEATVNGQGPYDFIIDTGATLSVAFENLGARQPFEPVPDLHKSVLSLSGARSLPAAQLGDIEAAGLKLEDHTGVVIPDWPGARTPQGVIGLDFLTRYIVFINAVDQRIEFYDPDDPPKDVMDELTRTRLRYNAFGQPDAGLYTVTVRINNHRVPMIFDLGASGTVLNYKALRRLTSGLYFSPHRQPGVNTGTRIRDIFGDQERARAVRAGPTRIARAHWPLRVFIVYNAKIFEELGVDDKPYGLLGADFMQRRNVILDFADERIYLSRSPVKPAP